MRRAFSTLVVCATMLAVFLAGAPGSAAKAAASQEVLALEGDVAPVHDPAAIKEGSTYYMFCTWRPCRAGRGSDSHLVESADVEGIRLCLRRAPWLGRC